MRTGTRKELNVDAFVALMAEMGVEAVPLPGSEPKGQDEESARAEGTESE
jgi:hypothetical protein